MSRGYYKSPTSLKGLQVLVGTIACISILSPVISFFLWSSFQLAGPQVWLPLSWAGLYHHYYWQLLTYPLVHSSNFAFSLSLLLSTTFHLIVFWHTAGELLSRISFKSFLLFLFLGILSGGLGGALFFFLTKSLTPLYGLTPLIISMALLWGMLLPTLELQLAFIYRVKATQLVLTGVLICVGYLALTGAFATLFASLFCSITAFLYAHFVWGLPNPYFDIALKKPKVDFPFFGHKESDEEFMERMLEKIHKEGLHSLSKEERKRMESISRRK